MKKILTIILVLGMVICLSSCLNDKKESQGKGKTESAPVEIITEGENELPLVEIG